MVCFNTQPPEGGWEQATAVLLSTYSFNTQPPEGGWVIGVGRRIMEVVSTHSRPKAAGRTICTVCGFVALCFNTQPPEGGWNGLCNP